MLPLSLMNMNQVQKQVSSNPSERLFRTSAHRLLLQELYELFQTALLVLRLSDNTLSISVIVPRACPM